MADYPISRYLHIRQAYWPSFSADEQQVAFITDVTGRPEVWQVGWHATGQDVLWPEQLTFGVDRVLGVWFSPVPGDRRLIYTADVGGNENAQILMLDPEGREVDLTTGYEEKMHFFGEWSADGRQILFAANRRDPALFDLYVQPVDGEARLVWQNDRPGYLSNLSFSPDNRRAVVTRTTSSFDHALFEVELETGKACSLLVSPGPVRFGACWYSADGRSLLLLTDLGSDLMYIARLDLAGERLESLLEPGWDCDVLARSPDGSRLVYALNVEGAHQIYLMDLDEGTTTPMPAIGTSPGILTDGRLVFSADGRRVACSFTSATQSADVWIWDLERNLVQQVTRSSHGGIPVASFVAPELIHYPTFDRDEEGQTRQIPAWFFKPAQEPGRPLPVVVVVHGGPEGQFRPNLQFFIQYLVHHGYAVLAPNVRGSTGYGKFYSHLDDVEKRMDSVADLAFAAHWLRSQPGIDGERLVVYGGSYGGFMVLSALTTYPDLWAAGVDIVGISSLVTFLENTSAYRRVHREAEYGSLESDRAFLEQIAPIRHVDRIAAPVMVIHGRNDPRVPLSEAEQLVAALERRGVPVQFLVFDDEGHGIVKLENKRVAYPAVIAFLDTTLFRSQETGAAGASPAGGA